MTNAKSQIDQVLNHLESDAPAAVDRLVEFLSIPSVSTAPTHAPDVARAADWVADRLRQCDLSVMVMSTPGHPVVVGRTTEGQAPIDAPTVLFYGHYDVQPPDPLDQWTSPPFEPDIRDGAIHARGASDDKGQVCCFLEALRAWRSISKTLPCHVIALIEGEEEVGSKHLPAMIDEIQDDLRADIVLISDTTMWDRETVAITFGLRGIVYFDLQLHNSNRDLHSGVYGGVLANPANMLCHVLGQLFDERHAVTIPHFYDDVVPVSEGERAEWKDIGFDEFKDCLEPVGVDKPFGEAGYSTLERKWCRPACDINGLYGGYSGAGAKTVIPSFFGAKVSFRLAPNQVPAKIAQHFRAWLESHDVHGCRWNIKQYSTADPVMMSKQSPYISAAKRAVEQTSGRPPVLAREGATIPVVSDFKKTLGLDSLIIGFGLSDDCIHAPNEKFDLKCFELGCRTHAALLAELAQVKRA